MIDEVIKIFGSGENYKKEVWGKQLNKDDCIIICNQYLERNNLNVNVYFSNNLVTSMTGRGLALISKPYYYRDIWLKSLLDHEIGTHYIRSVNHRNLNSYILESVKANRIGWLMATEEGLASLSNHLLYDKCNLLYK